MFPLLLVSLALGAEPVPPEVRVTLSDGQQLEGVVEELPEGGVLLTLGDGRVLTLPDEVVATMATLDAGEHEEGEHEEGEYGIDPNRSRYLYSPTAFSLGAGNGYVAQRALILSSVAIGVTDFLDVELGVILPTLFIPEERVGNVGVKMSFRASEGVHFGGGAQAYVLSSEAVGFFFGNVTFGSQDRHLTVAGGRAMDFHNRQNGAAVSTVSGSFRLSQNTALLTENWFFYFLTEDGPWGGPFFMLPSFGVRLYGPKFAVDLGLVPVFTGEREVPLIPAPLINFTWNFSVDSK